jgi:hypothetical protein
MVVVNKDGWVGIGTTTPTNPLHVASGSSNVVVASNGFVGIGTTMPQAALHVAGDINVTGGISCSRFGVVELANGVAGTSVTNGTGWSISTPVTISGTTLIFISAACYVNTPGSIETFTLEYSTDGSTWTSIGTIKNQYGTSSVHQQLSRTIVWSPVSSINVTSWRVRCSAIVNANDFLYLSLLKLPF